MKKNTLSTIYSALLDAGYESTDPIMEEIAKEINRGAEAKAKNAEAYEALHDYIVDELTDTPCTVAELWDVIKDDVPEGTTKGKVQYALTHLWQDEIVKIEGKPNTYRRA